MLRKDRFMYRYHYIGEKDILRLKFIVSDRSDNDINDIIEKYQICKLREDYKKRSIPLSDELQYIVSHSEKIHKETMKFFGRINDTNLLDITSCLIFEYTRDFFDLFEKCCSYNNISKEVFSEFIKMERADILRILNSTKMLNKYDVEIRKYLIDNDSAVMLLKIYSSQTNVKLPKSFTSQDFEGIIQKYVDSENPNMNYLEQIVYLKNEDSVFKLSDRLKFKARKRLDELNVSFFENRTEGRLPISTRVMIDENQEEYLIDSGNGFNREISYSGKWIVENLDFPTVMNNFIHLLQFIDEQGRITSIQMKCVEGVSKIFDNKVKHGYNANITFNILQTHENLKMNCYYDFLKNKGVSIENVLMWFCNEYIVNEFDLPPIKIKMPDENTPYISKCVLIATAMEGMLKQYNEYRETGKIDYEFLEHSNTSLAIEQIKSILDKKYAYPKTDLIRIGTLLFSKQSLLSFTEKHGERYENFTKLLLNEEINASDFEDYQKSDINYLMTNEIICEKNGRLQFENLAKIMLIKDMWHSDFMNCYYKTNFEITDILEDFETKDWIEYGDTLLSKSEIEYFNYHLNDKQFSNGLKLRNKYVHGANQGIDNETEHRKNYIIMLRLMILLILKINEELCTKHK